MQTFKHRLSVHKTFNQEINAFFDFTQDLDKRKDWDKQTADVYFMEDHSQLKKGAKVVTKSVEGIEMETEYTSFQRPNEIAIRMLNRSTIFKDFIGTWEYSDLSQNQTTLTITYQFNLKFPYRLIPGIVKRKTRSNMIHKLDDLLIFLNQPKAGLIK